MNDTGGDERYGGCSQKCAGAYADSMGEGCQPGIHGKVQNSHCVRIV